MLSVMGFRGTSAKAAAVLSSPLLIDAPAHQPCSFETRGTLIPCPAGNPALHMLMLQWIKPAGRRAASVDVSRRQGLTIDLGG